VCYANENMEIAAARDEARLMKKKNLVLLFVFAPSFSLNCDCICHTRIKARPPPRDSFYDKGFVHSSICLQSFNVQG
jgi:hypothetical protein